MAPKRKSKGTSTVAAAAAAAAKQKWKVGDLVLAKVKGFPAWPATVSEPEKWGYKPDSKKVVVFFFGTRQIAFCNHVDVEAFTEEKRQTLQGKRYGKSADFVRAVQEIIVSYDKLKSQEQNDGLSCSINVTTTNGGNSVGSLAESGTKDKTDNNSIPVIPLVNGSVSIRDKMEASPVYEAASSFKDAKSSPRVTGKCESLRESPYVLRKKPSVKNSEDPVTQIRTSSARRLRTSRIDTRELQDNDSPSRDCSIGIGNIVHNASTNRSPRGINLPLRSSQEFKKHVVDSPPLVSNVSPQNDNSVIASLECSSINIKEGCCFESTCVHEYTGTAGSSNGHFGPTKKHGLDIKDVFVKKKRKPNRKRSTTDGSTASAEKLPDLGFGVHNNRLNSPNACEKSDEQPSKVDFDEYLPLVKRARVRMGKHSDVDQQADTILLDMEEKLTNGCPQNAPRFSMNSLNNISSSELDDVQIKDRTFCLVQPTECVVDAKEARPDYSSKSLPNDEVDGESVLPPSKRLHRALEAMSVSESKDCQPCAEEQILDSSPAIIFNIFSSAETAATVAECDVGCDIDVIAANSNGMEADIHSINSMVNSPCIQDTKMPLVERAEQGQSSGMIEEEISNKAALAAPSDNCPSPYACEEKDSHEDIQSLVDQSLQDEVKHKRSDSSHGSADPSDQKISTSDSTGTSRCVDRKDDYDTSKMVYDIDTKNNICVREEHRQNGTLVLPLSEKMQADSMSAVDGEMKHDSSQSDISVDVVHRVQNSSHFASISDEASDEKDTLGAQNSSSHLNNTAQSSPLASSLHPLSSACNGSNIKSSGDCVNDKLLVKREAGTLDGDAGRSSISCSSGKLTKYVEAKASLQSFATALGTLTRTKDSIVRATRTAIECAKAGLAAKVVEIISRTLENESNLNRKVDLFFLVDSIMQCSRGMKGEVGGIFPSAIQGALPKLLSFAAPPGSAALENRRQCLKVLKLWLERRILPDSVISHHMQNLDSISSGSYSSGPFSRRSSRTERAFHDPLREMEGMLVDEYGSNSSLQLSGFCMPPMCEDDPSDVSDSDGEGFEAVTPEYDSRTPELNSRTPELDSRTPEEPERPTGERHRHILEDVDGELEMEDVAPSSEAEMDLSNNIGALSAKIPNNEANVLSFYAPPLPNDVPPSSPPLPSSPPPPFHPLPPPTNPIPPPMHPPPIHSLPSGPRVCPPPPQHSHSLPPPVSHPMSSHPNVNSFTSTTVCPPIYSQNAIHPSSDGIANRADSVPCGNRNNSLDNMPPVSPRSRQTFGDSLDYRALERHDMQRKMGVPEPSTNSSFDSFPGPRHGALPTNGHSVHPSNGVRHSDVSNFDNRGYPIRPPPHLPPPNQFPNVQGDHRDHHSWREGPPRSYPNNNYHRGPGRDERSFYNDHNWKKPNSHERFEDRRYYGPPFSGDKGGVRPYPPQTYTGPPNEHNRGRQSWGYPPRDIHHRNSMPMRPPSEGPRYWRQ